MIILRRPKSVGIVFWMRRENSLTYRRAFSVRRKRERVNRDKEGIDPCFLCYYND